MPTVLADVGGDLGNATRYRFEVTDKNVKLVLFWAGGAFLALFILIAAKWLARSDKPRAVLASEPSPVEPTYVLGVVDNAEQRARVDAAMRAVYARCSQARSEWREGSAIEGHDVFHQKGEPEMVNVGVNLARKEQVARGNTLWYRVTFKGGKPATFRANKQVSADMCALLVAEEERPL